MMLKKNLLAMRPLVATNRMMQMAAEDTPKKETITYWPGHSYETETRQYGLYLRCMEQDGILKVAAFLPDVMRLGARKPAYDVYIDYKNGRFLTYDHTTQIWRDAKLDRIDWPRCVPNSKEKWMSPTDCDTVKSCLGTEDGGYNGILSYQRGIRDQQLLARHRRETDPWDADLSQVPPLPKDWERWASRVGIPENYIFYHYDRKGVKSGYCTYCGHEVPISHPHYNKKGRCPCCRREVTYKSLGKFSRLWTPNHFMYLIQRCRDGFVIRMFCGHRYHCKEQYQTPELQIQEVRRAIYDAEGKALRAYYWGDYKHKKMRWIKGSLCTAYRHYWHNYESGRVYGKTIPDLARHELSRTGLPEMIQTGAVDPEHYLAVLREAPLLEKLAKAGLSRMAKECLENYSDFNKHFNETHETSLTRILGIHTQELKRLRQQDGGLRFLDWLRYERTAQTNVPDDVAAWFCAEKITADDVKFIRDRMRPEQIRNYVRRQMADSGMTSQEVLTTWADYLSMARRFDMDVNDEIVYRVRKLKQRHDELARMGAGKNVTLRAGRLIAQFPHVEEIMQSVKDKYEYSGNDYIILAPVRIEEVLQEADKLHHCIANSDRYWDRIEQRESYLLFLRKAENPDKPYYTLEVEPGGAIRQIRTYYDRQNEDVEAARAFLREWQGIVAERLDEADRAMAQASRTLREQEFAQLRKDQVTIHTGDLAGKLLVDILTSDLMESAA